MKEDRINQINLSRIPYDIYTSRLTIQDKPKHAHTHQAKPTPLLAIDIFEGE